MKLTEYRKQQREAEKESARLSSDFRGGVNEEDLYLAEYRKKQREAERESAAQHSTYKGFVNDVDVKLAEYKKQQREAERSATAVNASFQGELASRNSFEGASMSQASPVLVFDRNARAEKAKKNIAVLVTSGETEVSSDDDSSTDSEVEDNPMLQLFALSRNQNK